MSLPPDQDRNLDSPPVRQTEQRTAVAMGPLPQHRPAENPQGSSLYSERQDPAGPVRHQPKKRPEEGRRPQPLPTRRPPKQQQRAVTQGSRPSSLPSPSSPSTLKHTGPHHPRHQQCFLPSSTSASRSTPVPRSPKPHQSHHHHHHHHHHHQHHQQHQNHHQHPREVLPSLPPSSLSWPFALQAPSPAFSSPAPSPTAVTLPPSPGLYQDNNPDPFQAKGPPLPPPFRNGCRDVWRWAMKDKSHEVRLRGPDRTNALFHPNWSNGTAGVRGTKAINHGVHYWEIRVSSRLFGTSMMFGVATRKARLHADSFHNLLGEDQNSWGLSHKGLAWHGGRNVVFCPAFTENVAVCVGLVYDGTQGTLAYYKDGESLGVAFRGLNAVSEDLFPAVCSTAAKTEMTLGVRRRAFLSLQDRCRASVVQQLRRVGRVKETHRLPLPKVLCRYVGEDAA